MNTEVKNMVNIRTSVLEDISTISGVLASSWKSAYRGIVHDEYLDSLSDNHWIDFLNTGMNNETVFSMVLEQGKSMIGAAILSEERKEVHLISFYLIPEKIGHGFGHLFYNGVETELKRRGFAKCVLGVLQDNHRAIRFYETHGFFDTNRRIIAKLGECEYACKIYEKSLLA